MGSTSNSFEFSSSLGGALRENLLPMFRTHCYRIKKLPHWQGWVCGYLSPTSLIIISRDTQRTSLEPPGKEVASEGYLLVLVTWN